MSLRHALLALIEVGPTTGYALAKLFDQSATRIWYAQHSQIYTELRRMEAEGLVVAETVGRGERAVATKRPYVITDAGMAELERWVTEVSPVQSTRDPAYLKATYLEYGSLRGAREQFRAHRAQYEDVRNQLESHVEALERHSTDLLQRRLSVAPARAADSIVVFKVHAYRGLIDRANTEIEWARKGIELVDRLASTPGADLDEPIMSHGDHAPASSI